MDFQSAISGIVNFMWNGPILIYFCGIGAILTVGLYFIQFRKLWAGAKYSLMPTKSADAVVKGADLSPFQAFLNTLSTNLGNGSLAGMGVAIASGGPGAAFWLLIAGFFVMVIRYSEVYLGSYFVGKAAFGGNDGGPTAYLSRVPGGKVLPYVFSLFCLLYGLFSGNAMQCNSVGKAVSKVFGLSNPYWIAAVIFALLVYILTGGSKRIISISDSIVPVKVVVFFLSAIILLGYHYASIFSALNLIFVSAFSSKAMAGGVAGVAIQRAIQYGFTKSINATEAGLGTAAVFFGSAGGKSDPVNNGLMSMFSAFISNYLVCFIIGLSIVASGAWTSGLTSVELTIGAYETVYGFLGAWIVAFCSISFGIGCLVAYAYVSRECWLFLTSGRFVLAFNIIYCLVAVFGVIASVEIVWGLCDLVNICLLAVNMFGVIWLIPVLRKGVKEYLA